MKWLAPFALKAGQASPTSFSTEKVNESKHTVILESQAVIYAVALQLGHHSQGSGWFPWGGHTTKKQNKKTELHSKSLSSRERE